jgi:hypothetical protein
VTTLAVGRPCASRAIISSKVARYMMRCPLIVVVWLVTNRRGDADVADDDGFAGAGDCAIAGRALAKLASRLAESRSRFVTGIVYLMVRQERRYVFVRHYTTSMGVGC